MSAHVSWISLTPVKALALNHVEEIDLLEQGLRGDRRFFLIDAKSRLVNNKGRGGPLQLVHAEYDEDADVLTLRFPDSTVVSGEVERGGEVSAMFHRWPRAVREVLGPFGAALSEPAGDRVRLVEAAQGAADRGRGGAVSLLTEASLGAIGDVLGVGEVDRRRFRMNFGIEGLEAHEEDTWLGRRVRVGEAVVVPQGNIGRCAVTTQGPDTGKPDLDTLKALAGYRGEVVTTEPLPFGIHAAVAEPGRVRLGDAVTPL